MDHLVRNADGDELLFIHAGRGDFYCDFGHLRFCDGDYILIPRGTMWRIEAEAAADIMLIESTGLPYSLPERGMVGRHSPFDTGALDRPTLNDAFKAQQGKGRWVVLPKRGNRVGEIRFAYNPLDAAGWQGDLYPVRLNIRDIRPISGHRAHLPPSAHTTFLGNRFVVCTFVPRPLETDPAASKLPFFHNNDDYDELLFVHRGDFPNRPEYIKEGALTFHPAGFTHGPHPHAMDSMFNVPVAHFESYIMMIDALDVLNGDPIPEGVEIADYNSSWRKAAEWARDLVGEDARRIPPPKPR